MTDVQPGLNPSDADYLGTDHAQLQQYLGTNLDVQQVAQVSAGYDSVRKAFEDFATHLADAVTKSKGTWHGTAATSALDYFATLATWAETSAENAGIASKGLEDQGNAAQTAKNTMPEAVPFNWDDEFKTWQSADPFTLADTIDKTLQKQQDSHAAHEQAAQVMTEYDQNLYSAASKQPAFAAPPTFAAVSGGGAAPDLPSSADSSSSSGGGASGGASPAVSLPDPSQHAAAAVSSMSGPGSTTGAVAVHPGGGTTPQAYNAVTPAAAAPGPAGASGGMPMGAMPMGGMGGGGLGGDTEYSSKIGQSSGFGPGGGDMEATPSASGAARPRGMGGSVGGWRDHTADEIDDGRRFLVDGDSDEVFGDDSITAPPVIGE